MTIQHKEMQDEGMFFIAKNEEVLAQLVYTKQGNDRLVIEHTEVAKPLRGNTIGYELVHRTVEFARMHGLKILPLCPFAKEVFEKKPDFRDVLA